MPEESILLELYHIVEGSTNSMEKLQRAPKDNETIVMYKSWYDMIELMPQEEKLPCYEMFARYGFYGIEPGADVSVMQKIFFNAFRTQLDTSTNRYKACVENGGKGGAPKGNTNACKNNPKQPKNNLKQPKNNQTNNQTNNLNDNENDNSNDNANGNENDNSNDKVKENKSGADLPFVPSASMLEAETPGTEGTPPSEDELLKECIDLFGEEKTRNAPPPPKPPQAENRGYEKPVKTEEQKQAWKDLGATIFDICEKQKEEGFARYERIKKEARL